ncbi:hypothetical protein LTS18_005260, partial [Coniosporium uncinatum]
TSMLLPEELYALLQNRLDEEIFTLHYSKLYMTLTDIISGDFFTTYIKTPGSNILMLSEGRTGIDPAVFSLRDGILRLEFDKATYERCGLQGKPVQDARGGRKHVKARWVVEVNLRLPSMVYGKKGFSRLEYAFKNVLNQSVTWLFTDLSLSSKEEGVNVGERKPPVAEFQPKEFAVRPTATRMEAIKVPVLKEWRRLYDEIEAEELQEWLGLAFLDSPRVREGDGIDSFLSRYSVPTFDRVEEEDKGTETRNLVRLSWHGLASPKFVLGLWIVVRKYMKMEWVALNVGAFGGKGYTVMGSGKEEALVWEYD